MKASASRCAKAMALAMVLCSTQTLALNLLTEENPPFNYSENKKVMGQSTDVVTELARRAGIPISFQIMDWAPAYTKAQEDKDTCLYSTARLPNREKIFKWVGPIATNNWALFAKAGFPDKISTLRDARHYRIGGVAHDAKVELLRQEGVTNIVTADKDQENPPKLTINRKEPDKIDLWVTGANSAQDIARQAGVTDLKMVLMVREEPLYLACSPRTSAETIKKLSDALNAMNRDGALKKNSNRYTAK